MATLKKYTMKLDRISNNTLQLGLLTGLTLTGATDGLTVNKPVLLATQPTWSDTTNDATLTTKYYVDTVKNALQTSIDTAVSTQLYAGDRINISKYADDSNWRTISLGTLYDSSKTFDAKDIGGEGHVIAAVTVDKYGTVTGVSTKKISTADLDNTTGTYDNYSHWILKVGETSLNVNSGLSTGDPALYFAGGTGLTATLSGQTVTYSINLNTDHLELSDNKLAHKQIHAAETTSGLYKFALDKAGHVSATTAVEKADLTNLIGAYTGSSLGLVKGTSENTVTAKAGETYFYTSSGAWATIPFNNVKVTQSTATTAIPILVSPASDSTAVQNVNNVTITPSTGTLTASKLVGNGESITNINASNITSGTLSADRLPAIDASKVGINLSENTGSILYSKGTGFGYANLSDTTTTKGYYFLGKNIATDATLAAAQQAAPAYYNLSDVVAEYLNDLDALVLKGTVGSVANDSATIETVDTLTNFKAGWRYIVVTNGTYAGQVCEVGDILTAVKDYDASYGSATAKDYWLVTQANINGAVTMAADGVSGTLMISSGGKTIQSSAYSITNGTLNANAATASKLASDVTLWGQTFNGTANVSGDLSNVGAITPSASETYDIGSENNKFKTIYATTFNGKATEAAKTTGTLSIAGTSFDGSTDVEVSLAALGGLSDVTISNTEGTGSTGSFITGIELSDKTVDGKPVKEITLTKSAAIKSISSSIFNISTENEASTISFLTSAKAGAFSRSGTNDLVYTGNISATRLYANNYDNASKEVALLKSGTVSDAKSILVASQSKTSTSDYDFVMSSYKVAEASEILPTDTTKWNSDVYIPTAASITQKVTSLIATSESGNMKMAKYALPTNDGTHNSTFIIPNGAVVKRVAVDITSAFSSGATLQILVGSEEYVGTQDIIAYETGLYIFEYYNTLLSNSTLTVVVSGSTSSANPAGSIMIEYATPIE